MLTPKSSLSLLRNHYLILKMSVAKSRNDKVLGFVLILVSKMVATLVNI